MTDKAHPIKCDCCQHETMATLVDGNKLVITDKRHGERHWLTIQLPQGFAVGPKERQF